MAHDPRLTPARGDLAAARLKGEVEAERYAEGETLACVVAAAPIRQRPDETAPMDDQLLFGYRFEAFEIRQGWAWGQSLSDSYVGYVGADQLTEPGPAPNRRVSALRTYAFSEPSIKSAPNALLSLNARVHVAASEGRFAHDPSAGWIIAEDLALPDRFSGDYVAEAERFLHAPYLWGGKESIGLDCSGLVQMALAAAGVDAPRDSDMQEAGLGRPVAIEADLSGLQRGDLLFWAGHVAIMMDDERMIHANAHHMRVAIEPVRPAVNRIAANGAPLRAVKRL